MSTTNPFATPIASTGNLASDIEGVNNAASGPSQAASPYNEKQSEAGKASLFRKPKVIGLAIFAVVAVIALGVGLGVGLSRKPATEHLPTGTPNKLNGGSPASSSVSAPSPTVTFKTPRTLIDSDTPKSAFSIAPINNGAEMTLVFSDEFNSDSRTFGEGDEPYWTAENLHDWQTNQMVYYDPSAITTKNGSLEISLTKQSINGYEYKSGMLSSWNKFCFTGGRIEARVQLPGADNVLGLWPSIYAVGNLARAGYAASTDGVWPYSYDSCDIGTAANQSINGLPTASVTGGDPFSGGVLSWQPGQRLSRCTCSDETHPGPKHADGSFVGRGAPEIDMFEGVASRAGGIVMQSAQIAPFNAGYYARNTSSDIIIVDSKLSSLNAYRGGVMQQSISVNTQTDQAAYQLTGGSFSVFGFEYKSGFDNAYITWISGGKATWSLMSSALGADPMTEISSRPVSQEPMYLVMSLGMSQNFGMVDLEHLAFPAVMRIDYVRVYQPKDAVKITCDPTDFPTAAYIEKYKKAYTDPKLTTWKEATGQTFPKNQLVNGC